MSLLPTAESCPQEIDKSKLLKQIHQKQLVGLCNNTKWNEILTAFRDNQWFVANRSKWINGQISQWENDWAYHLPFPFLGVEWFDICYEKVDFHIENGGRHTVVTNLKNEILEFIKNVGVEFEFNNTFVRVWGYAPKCYLNFNNENT
ncbi:DUF6678 family protein [Pseudoalteromonas phenolica]|uniref:Uncharacterized protein n=1 Tax=Pseudoalteromonas phenolica TaxID=161398 RepID=A0A0S2K3Z2_9GAMM|nr:DUF6678 family protein [Pseudoalteromonas phenolica]ALO42783.1 hypothetical protein PP2015_2286 [Pseudoalteromonas phenolica]MBE0356085.1 hypothetical protein [Pseudoalteromonas phenolica O-BC30]MBE0356828.1 hypothetical protein [Pseudoalteromonas phenolica O-BC30]